VDRSGLLESIEEVICLREGEEEQLSGCLHLAACSWGYEE